jgi:hypothetical protein
MSCGGGHLGFPIGIKNTILVKDIPMIIYLQFGFSLISSLGPKVQVNYCHHLASVVCHPSSVNFQASSPKPLGQLEPNLAGMFLGWSCTKFLFFVPVGYSTWLPGPIICSDWLNVLWWRPSWISDRHKKHNLGKGYSNDHLFTVWVQSVH